MAANKAEEQNEGIRISGSLIARNALLNLIGQAVPLLVGVVTIPFVVRGLGVDRFGLLSLAWVVLGYFTIFDLGLGRATTKYVAEAVGRGEDDQIPKIVWTSVTVQAAMGLIGALVLVGITDLLVERILNIPPELLSEAKDTFHLLALSIPLVLVSSSFSGVMEAVQRFDLVNAVRIPSSALTYILPLVGVNLGWGLPGIVALLLLARLATLVAFITIDLRIVPHMRRYSGSAALLSRLFSFGGWITVSSMVGPILVYLDRFIIGTILTIAALAYYTAPYEAVTRLWIVSASLTATLFPAFSTLDGSGRKQTLGMFFSRSVKYVLLTTGPVVVVIYLFAGEILQIWLGSDFAAESTLAMQVLAFGVLINSLAHTPFAFLQGIGRPDIPAKFHLLELPVYLVAAWILVSRFGIPGAAGAWTMRVALDAFLLFVAAFKIYEITPDQLAENGAKVAAIGLVTFGCIGFMLRALEHAIPLAFQFLLIVGVLLLFAWAGWKHALDDLDRRAVHKIVDLKNMLEGIS